MAAYVQANGCAAIPVVCKMLLAHPMKQPGEFSGCMGCDDMHGVSEVDRERSWDVHEGMVTLCAGLFWLKTDMHVFGDVSFAPKSVPPSKVPRHEHLS